MGLMDDLRARGTDFRVSDDDLHAEAQREIDTGVHRHGVIWAMALIAAEMDHTKAHANYIAMRVEDLKEEIALLVKDAARAQALNGGGRPMQCKDFNGRIHSNCGGVIERTVADKQVTWTCQKCHTSASFERMAEATYPRAKG